MSAIPPILPVEDFFSNPEKAMFSIAPDGRHIAWLAPWQSRLNVFVQNISSGAISQATRETERDISMYHFANNARILYLLDDGGDENFHVFAADIDGANSVCLTPFPGVRVHIADMLPEQDNEVLISMNQRNPQVFDVYNLNVSTGELNLVAENPGNVIGWLTDHEGAVRTAIASDGVNHTILYRDTAAENFRPIASTNFRENLSPLGFSFDNRKLYVLSNRGRDTSGVYLFNPQTALEEELLYANDTYDCKSAFFSRKRKCLSTIHYIGWKNERVFFDDGWKNIYERLGELLPGKNIGVSDHDKEEENLIVHTYSDVNPGSYYLYNVATNSLSKLADTRPGINEEEMAAMKPVHYTTRDGLTVHGYLTLPVGREAKNLPVIMFPHGGPWVRDKWGYDGRVQFFANRGYAVLKMNYRGSTGYGRRFWEASFKQWGRAMQDDITDAVHWLVGEGIADPERVAIVGGSYGGYAVLAGLAFTPDLYACGVDIVGVSNLFTFRQTIPEYWKPLNDMSNEMIGDPVADEELLRSVSPVFHAHNISAPLLVFQGAKDPRVNIAESDQIVNALRSKGIDVEYIVKDDEGHGFQNEENKMEMYSIIEAFLKKHLG